MWLSGMRQNEGGGGVWMGWALCDNIFMATCVLLKAWYKAQRINNWSPINPSCLILFDQTNTETHTHTRGMKEHRAHL